MLFVKSYVPSTNILQWRKENAHLILTQYIPFLFQKLEETGKYEIKLQYELSSKYSSEGFHPQNILLLKVKKRVIPIDETLEYVIKVVTPNYEDVIYLGKPHILVSCIIDNGYYIRNGEIRFYKFMVTKDGLVSNGGAPVALFKILKHYNLLDKFLGEYELLESVPSDYELKGYYIVKGRQKYLVVKNNKVTPVQKLIADSFAGITDVLYNYEVQTIEKWFEAEVPYDLQFVEKIKTFKEILIRALKDYNKYSHYSEIHIKFKRLRYLETLLDPLAYKIQKIKKLVEKQNDSLILKQKIPHDIITQYAKTCKLLQYLDFTNPLEEIAYKTKVVLNLDNPPAYLRDTHLTYTNYICPLDTPDNENVGKNRHLAIDAPIDEYGRFILN